MSTQPARGSGFGASARASTSGPPVCAKTIAFIPSSLGEAQTIAESGRHGMGRIARVLPHIVGRRYRPNGGRIGWNTQRACGDSPTFPPGRFLWYSYKLRIVITRASYVRAPEWSTPVRYALAVAVAFAAAALRGLLSTVWGDASPFLLFVPAIVLSAWAGGFGPGIVTTVLGALLASFFWLPPVYSFRLATWSELIGLAIFVAIGATIGGISEAMHRGR